MALNKSSTIAVGTKGALGASNTVAGQSTATQTKPAKGFRLQLQQMLTGLQTVLPSDGALMEIGAQNAGKLPVTTLIQQVQAGLGAYSAVDSAELAQKAAHATLEANLPVLKAQYAAMKQALVAFFGASGLELAQFGLKPKQKATPLSPEAQVASTAKRLETRKIRNTRGPKQKAKLKFTGTVAVAAQVTPVAAPTAASPQAPEVAATPSPGSSGPSSGSST